MFNSLVKLPAFLRPAIETAPIPSTAIEDAEENRGLLSEHILDETAALPADLGQSGFDALPPHEHPAGAEPEPTRR